MSKKPHELLSQTAKTEPALATARDFLRSLAAGRRAEARALASTGLRWFGRNIDAAEWGKSELAQFFTSVPTTVSAVRPLERELLVVFSKKELGEMFDGPLAEGEVVVLADVLRGKTEVTVIIVVSTARARPEVVRVVDPSRFQQHLKARSASA